MNFFSQILGSALPQCILMFFESRKSKPTKAQTESLKNDLLRYVSDFSSQLQSLNNNSEFPEGKVFFGEDSEVLKKKELTVSDINSIYNLNDSPIEIGFKNYIKEGDYGKYLSDLFIKLNAYGDCIKQCLDKYPHGDREKLYKEREVLEKYIDSEFINLKKAYIDFILTMIHPELEEPDRKYFIYETVDKLKIEPYIEETRNFLDKIDQRII